MVVPHLLLVSFTGMIVCGGDMRKTLALVLALMLLWGCVQYANAPTATPVPAAEEIQYYPTVTPDIAETIIQQLPSRIFPKRYYESPNGNYFVAMAVSTARVERMKAGKWMLDVLWVYERNAGVALYPLILGVSDGDSYTPYLFPAYDDFPKEREAYFRYLEENFILEGGRLIFPRVQGDFVHRTGIDWESCGESTFCQVGQYMQEKYNLDRAVELGIVGINYPIPKGWALAWYWIPATDKNSLPESQEIDLP
jgi:hypothetical protein